jgi:hypothetical protein
MDGQSCGPAKRRAAQQKEGSYMKENKRFITKRRSFLAGILGVLLVFGLVLPGCSDGTSDETDTSGKPDKPNETDTWSAVTNLDQLNGTWKSSTNRTTTIKEWVESNGGILNAEAQSLFGDMTVNENSEVITIIDAAAQTQAYSMTGTFTFSGGNIGNPSVWETIDSMFLRDTNLTLTTDDEKHSVTRTQTRPAQTMTEAEIAEMLAAGIQINQTGTKIKVPARLMGQEITYIKQ